MHLSWLLLIPYFASCLLMGLSFTSIKRLKTLAFCLSLLPLCLLIFDKQVWTAEEINLPWATPLGIHLAFRLDPLASIFVALTSIIIPLVIWISPCHAVGQGTFFALTLLLQGLLFSFFTSQDLAFFTFFWEAMLLPLYFIINLWGKELRQKASLVFLVTMAAGTFLMVLTVVALFTESGSFHMDQLAKTAGQLPHATLLLGGFLLAFAVKTPLFPFHAWLPLTYTQASTPGTILLSALLSKAGIFGVLRVGYGLFPSQMLVWNPYLLTLAITGVFYAGFAAWRQHDYKALLAYSSLSHVNFILAGLFIASETAHTGAIVQAFNHGIVIAGLFMVAGWLEERVGTTEMNLQGLAKPLPFLCWLTLFFVLASVSLPGTNSFVGEILILFGVFEGSKVPAIVLAGSVILSVMYMLRWMEKTYFREPSSQTFPDIRLKNFAVALPLIILVLWIGIYPAPLLKQIEKGDSSMTKESRGTP